MPGMSSPGIRKPTSMIRILPLYSSSVMLRPTSPNPPKGMMRSFLSVGVGAGCCFMMPGAGAVTAGLPKTSGLNCRLGRLPKRRFAGFCFCGDCPFGLFCGRGVILGPAGRGWLAFGAGIRLICSMTLSNAVFGALICFGAGCRRLRENPGVFCAGRLLFAGPMFGLNGVSILLLLFNAGQEDRGAADIVCRIQNEFDCPDC